MGFRGSEDGGLSLPGRASARGLQPRLVLALLLGASFVGAWVAHPGQSLSVRVTTWAVVVTLGLLGGGLYWRLALFDRDAFDRAETERRVGARWRRIETAAVLGFVLSGLGAFALGAVDVARGVGGIALGGGVVAAVPLWAAVRRFDDATRWRESTRVALLLVAVLSLAGFARAETGPTLLDWAVRFGHVGSFSLWVGGAAWHNGVVLPTVRSRPEAADALKSQARAFRRHLPVVIALLFVTGGFQTVRLLGRSVAVLFASPVGRLVGVKVFVLTALTALVAVNYRRNG